MKKNYRPTTITLATLILLVTMSRHSHAEDLHISAYGSEIIAQGAKALATITREQQPDWSARGNRNMKTNLKQSEIQVRYAGDAIRPISDKIRTDQHNG